MKLVIEAKISTVVDIPEDEVENLTEENVEELLIEELFYGNLDIEDLEWY